MRVGSYPVYYFRNQENIKKTDKDLTQQKEIINRQMQRVSDSDTLSDIEKSKRIEKFQNLLKTIDEKLETGTIKNPYTSDHTKIEKEDIPLAMGLRGDRAIKKGRPLLNILRDIREDFSDQISSLKVHESVYKKEDNINALLRQIEGDSSFLNFEEAKQPTIIRGDLARELLSLDHSEKRFDKNGKSKSSPRMLSKMTTYSYFDVRNVERMLPNIKNPKVNYRELDLML